MSGSWLSGFGGWGLWAVSSSRVHWLGLIMSSLIWSWRMAVMWRVLSSWSWGWPMVSQTSCSRVMSGVLGGLFGVR